MNQLRVGVDGKQGVYTQRRVSSSKAQDSTKLEDEYVDFTELLWVDPMEQEDIWQEENYS